jgi:hypothetical protein
MRSRMPKRWPGKDGGLECFRGREAPGMLTLVIWFMHIRMFLVGEDPTRGKRRGCDKLCMGTGEEASEWIMCCGRQG